MAEQHKNWDNKRKRWNNRHTINPKDPKTGVLSMTPGNRTLSIITINPDHMTTKEARDTITEQMLRNNIHIAGVQETHIQYNQDYATNGYRTITTAATKISTGAQTGLPIGGVAIIVHEQIAKHIIHINRISHRIMTITLHSIDTHTPVTIISPYAPHKGIPKIEQKEHWEQTQETIKNIPKKHIIIRCTDANGQIGKINTEETYPRRIIGRYTINPEAEKGNGKHISKICYQENMIPVNTWKRAPLTKEEK